MILKTEVRDRASVMRTDSWIYIDRVAKAQNFGWINHEDLEGGAKRVSCTSAELRQWVAETWGTDRSFMDELWPEFSDEREQISVSVVKLTRDDGSMILCMLAGETFLMSEDGRTLDRLR